MPLGALGLLHRKGSYIPISLGNSQAESIARGGVKSGESSGQLKLLGEFRCGLIPHAEMHPGQTG